MRTGFLGLEAIVKATMLKPLLALLRKALQPKAQTRAILRDERSEGDLRYLGATYSSEGTLVIEGQDLGAGGTPRFPLNF